MFSLIGFKRIIFRNIFQSVLRVILALCSRYDVQGVVAFSVHGSKMNLPSEPPFSSFLTGNGMFPLLLAVRNGDYLCHSWVTFYICKGT